MNLFTAFASMTFALSLSYANAQSPTQKRMVAHLGNWDACPSDEQIAQYTHIVVDFAVSYTWSPGKNICSTTCEIDTPPTCGNEHRPDLMMKWKKMGKKIILSFGGAGMGGIWAGNSNDCWEYCFGRENQVVDRLTDIVTGKGFDGVNIDYEYFYEYNQNGSSFEKGEEAQEFLKQVTIGLRLSLLSGEFEITHSPMETDLVPGTGYFELLRTVADSLDFLMPQYYNGNVQPYDNFEGALTHYTDLVNDLFGGDATKIVFGFCIKDCKGFNLSGEEAKEVMRKLEIVYPRNGGAFFWAVKDDVNGVWSSKVNEQLGLDGDESLLPSSPTPSPIAPPPTAAPGTIVCTAIAQSELPNGVYATTNEFCGHCATDDHAWPCDRSPPLCKCAVGGRRATRRMLRSNGRS